MEKIDEVLEFYNAGAEKGRLERGLGKIEFYRTKEILMKYITDTKNIIYDIGGGIGIYSSWLSELNNEVHLLELSPIIRLTEHEEEIMGMRPHFMIVSRK